jgi:hypothetical protein
MFKSGISTCEHNIKREREQQNEDMCVLFVVVFEHSEIFKTLGVDDGR